MGYLYDKNGNQIYDFDGNAIAITGADYISTHSGAEIDTFISQIVLAVRIHSKTKSKISSITGMDISTITIQSNQALQAWEARADGNGHGTGDLVGSGGALAANTNQTFDVEDSELTWGDKAYRINVYGQNVAGDWSEYET
jgi:hypothetical protein